MQQIVEQGNATKDNKKAADRAKPSLEKSQGGDRGPECHQEIQERWRILPAVEERANGEFGIGHLSRRHRLAARFHIFLPLLSPLLIRRRPRISIPIGVGSSQDNEGNRQTQADYPKPAPPHLRLEQEELAETIAGRDDSNPRNKRIAGPESRVFCLKHQATSMKD